jgi:hypothetical protein
MGATEVGMDAVEVTGAAKVTVVGEKAKVLPTKTEGASHAVAPCVRALILKSNNREPERETNMADLDTQTQTELEAAAFRTLVQHLRDHPEVQNIDLMNLADFCRNCLSKWYKAAADEKGIDIDYEAVRESVYGMPYAEWKDKHQTEAMPEQLAKMKEKAEH